MDLRTGKPLWQSEPLAAQGNRPSWYSPVLVAYGDVMLWADGKMLTGLDAVRHGIDHNLTADPGLEDVAAEEIREAMPGAEVALEPDPGG